MAAFEHVIYTNTVKHVHQFTYKGTRLVEIQKQTALRLPPLDLKKCLYRGIMRHMTVLASPQETAGGKKKT